MVVMTALVLAVAASAVRAEIALEMVTVGNAGNAGEVSGRSAGGYGPTAIVGAVDYVYAIGKYEVTAGQYTEFLNAVAATDTYGLYSIYMSEVNGCQIVRSGVAGSYSYSVANDRANRPVNYVDWGDAARFINWLHNGQGNGSTETGAYTLNGETSRSALMAITRNTDAKFWIPTENEWYKAAYHKNDGVTGNYWDYPTASDSKPSNLLSPDIGNNANFWDDGFTIDSPYWMTEKGAFTTSESPYGTFDQGGNVWEWNEMDIDSSRGLRGGSWYFGSHGLSAAHRDYFDPTSENFDIGFRVASVPEPGSLTLMLCGGVAGLFWWKCRKRSPLVCRVSHVE